MLFNLSHLGFSVVWSQSILTDKVGRAKFTRKCRGKKSDAIASTNIIHSSEGEKDPGKEGLDPVSGKKY